MKKPKSCGQLGVKRGSLLVPANPMNKQKEILARKLAWEEENHGL